MRRFLPALLATTILAGCLPKPAWYSPAADLGALAGGALVRACRAGEPVACAELAGQIAAAGPGDPARETALYHLRIEACERGTDETACERLGYDHVYGVWPNVAPLRTQAALVAACGREVGAACYLAGSSLDEGRLGLLDEVGSFDLFRKGCTLGQPKCCSWVGLKLEFGRGVPQNATKAYAFYEQACTLGEQEVGCFNQGLFLARGTAGVEDLPRALELMRRACDDGVELACENVPVVLEMMAAGEGE
jgi:TPR repeat protein